MNLIFDKREKEEDRVEEKFQADTAPIEEIDTSIQPEKSIGPKKIRKKGLPAGFIYFIIIPLLVMTLVVIYLFYFNKDVVFKYKNQILPPKISSQDTTDKQPAVPGREIVQPSDTTQVVSQVLTQEISENLSTRIIGEIVNNLGPALKLTTLYMDENAFSAQITTNSQTDLEQLYSKLDNNLPDNVKFDSTPTISNSQAFISGTYTVPQRSEAGKPSKTFNRATLETELSELVSKTNTRKNEFSLGPNQVWNDKIRALIFVKIEGSIANCQQFVNDFLHSGWDLHVSKIILMPSNDQRAVLVLRVFIQNPA